MVINNKKVLIIIVLIVGVILLAGFVFIVNAFTGNPVSKAIAQNKIQKYIREVYSPDSEVKKTYYSLKDRGYFSEVEIGNQTMTMKFSFNQIVDENVTDYFQNKFNDDYSLVCESLADDYLEFPGWIYIYTSVAADGNYSSDFDTLHVWQKIYLLGVKNYDKIISESDSRNMPSKIANQFINELGDRYNFKSIQMLYMDKFGLYEIIIDNKELTIDELSKNTRKMDYSEIGEEGKAFIEHLNQ